MISYFIGLSLTHVALYLMDTAQPALLYLVPCILLSTIITGLCRKELKELYTGRRIQLLFEDKTRSPTSPLLADSDNSVGEQTNQSPDVVVGISDTIGTVTGVESG
jgi:signal peptide peptidase-like protein 2B